MFLTYLLKYNHLSTLKTKKAGQVSIEQPTLTMYS